MLQWVPKDNTFIDQEFANGCESAFSRMRGDVVLLPDTIPLRVYHFDL